MYSEYELQKAVADAVNTCFKITAVIFFSIGALCGAAVVLLTTP